ncbi:MAG TPA: hypothetical protein VKA44_02260 [Gemmatimonadota bacterium]|nr:hypothetical protein [Gemmatimonadota bacterium]
MPGSPGTDRWHEADELFDRALDLEPGERSAFLDERCAGDPELRRAVEGLLAADAEAGRFLTAGSRTWRPRRSRTPSRTSASPTGKTGA